MMDFDQRLSMLRERYRASLPDKRDMLNEAWSAVAARPDDAEARARLHMLLHRLAGSAPSYGHDALGVAAAAAADRLGHRGAAEAPAADDLVATLAPCMDAVAAAFAGVIGETHDAGGGNALRILLVDDGHGHAGELATGLRELGCEVLHVAQPHAFWQVATTWPCDAVVLDDRIGAATVRELVGLVRGEPTFARIRIACLVDTDTTTTTQDLRRRGLDACFARQVPPQWLLQRLREQAGMPRPD